MYKSFIKDYANNINKINNICHTPDEPYQAKLDKLPHTALLCDEPEEKVLTFSSARLSEKSKDFLDNATYQALEFNKATIHLLFQFLLLNSKN